MPRSSTLQFYLLWGILFINVTAGIGILAQASPMMQDIFRRPRSRRPRWSRSSASSMPAGVCSGRRSRTTSAPQYISDVLRRAVVLFLLIPGWRRAANGLLLRRPVRRVHDVRRRIRHHPRVSGGHLRPRQRRRDSRSAADGVERRGSGGSGDHHRVVQPRQGRAGAGREPIHIYDKPLEVLAGLLAVGFVLTLLVRPLRHSRRPAEDTAAA